MKVISYSLFCFILCSIELCDSADECQDKDDKFPNFNCIIKVTIIDTEDGENCGPYSVMFTKYHCGGGASNQMNYDFNDCYQDGEVTYIGRQSIINHAVDFKTGDDYLLFYLYDSSDNELTSYQYGAASAQILTQQQYSKSGILVTFTVPDYQVSVRALSK